VILHLRTNPLRTNRLAAAITQNAKDATARTPSAKIRIDQTPIGQECCNDLGKEDLGKEAPGALALAKVDPVDPAKLADLLHKPSP
jgi:hypothetical protein